jgi:hypothetical protein
VPGLALKLAAIIHANAERSSNMILKVRHLAAVSLGDRLNTNRPTPSGLKPAPPKRLTIDTNQLEATLWKLTDLIRLFKILHHSISRQDIGIHRF